MDTVALLRDEMRDLMKVVRLLKQQHQHRGAPVAPGMAGMLAAIDRLAGGCHLKELAQACALDQSTTSRAVSSFVQAGLVRRVADPRDGRASFLELTDDGRQALREADEWYRSLFAAALGDWSPADVDAFRGLLRRFTEALAATAVPSVQPEATR
ncbi:MarR family transcriptional regulator [Dactylosporangium sp. AC04546]|uniref:MarR family winged helix-turn-helix transcriptional regulator n=1 Tax=Dactylosporangium sp. AC04546 TaxID=2862460 RepID=UPI001EE04B07|nr:MarR family transcriptional regulator [Dactylosporangium sp. AC04546]WVK86105.1 MarR family transcriptional regulator [Dactylosporangium sp. AC04546]